MSRKFLNPDNPLMITLSQISDVIFLSLFYLLCCFPVVTAGASAAALYDSSFRAFRQGERNSWQRFFSVFRRNIKSSILPAVLYAVCFFALLKGAIFLWNKLAAGEMGFGLFSAGAFLVVWVLGIISLIFPMLSRFDNGFAQLVKNTLFLSLANLPRSFALGLLNAVYIFLCVRFIVPIFFLPALKALISTWFIEPIFKPYM